MINKLPFKFLLSVLAFFMGFLSITAQVSLRKISLKEQIDNSSLVVEGKVIAKRSFWDADHRLIYTANTVEVYKVFKGEPVGQLEIITIGGIVGLNALMVSHGLKLGKGSIGVFTLYDSNFNIGLKNKTKNKQFKVYSGVQGFYAYNLEENIAVNPFSKRKGIKSLFYKDILDITKKSFKSVTLYDIAIEQKKSALINSSRPPTGIMFTPTTIEAGIGSVLTITGSGFGSTPGKVGFKNADDGGASYFDALDSHIEFWDDDEIRVRVPVIAANDVNIDGTAGTGAIRVTDSAGSSNTSSTVLTISYAEINISGDFGVGDGFVSYQTQHYDDNGSGGYTWIMEDDFFNESTHIGAPDAFLRAFDNWRCETKVNWEVSSSTTSTTVISTTENIIAFDVDGTSSELAAGVLGTCFYTFSGTTCTSGIVWYVADLDIIFDREASWFFGTGTIGSEEFDFETVVLHELGHGHQLGHVINTDNVMHYAIGKETINTVLEASSIAAANDVHSRSTASLICSPTISAMVDYAGSCNLSIEDIDLDSGVAMYPNPASQRLFIKNVSAEKLERIVIFDVSGRLISDLDVSETSGTKTINLQNTSKGIYFVNIHSGPNIITKKLIVE